MVTAIAFDSVVWLPNALILTAILLAVTFFVWRSKGLRAGLRMFGVSLLPLGLYFVGVWGLLWHVGLRISYFVSGFILHPTVWLGLIMIAVALVLLIVPKRLSRALGGAESTSTGSDSQRQSLTKTASKAPAGRNKADDDEDFGDVTDILKRHGID